MSKDNSLDNSPAAFFTPAHGRGKLRIIRHGEVLNPSGLSGRYQEVRRLAVAASPEAMKTLIAIMSDPSEDARARIVAATAVLDRAFGKPKEIGKNGGGDGSPAIELAGASEAQLRLLLATVMAAEKVIDGGGDGD